MATIRPQDRDPLLVSVWVAVGIFLIVSIVAIGQQSQILDAQQRTATAIKDIAVDSGAKERQERWQDPLIRRY